MKTRLTALAAAISSLSLLTACGGGGGPGTFEPIPLKPQVSVSAPTTTTAGTPFNISWTSANTTSCNADFNSSTAIANTVSQTETTTGTFTYTITCTGEGGLAVGTTSVQVDPATAEGLWQGSTGNGRVVTGAVTKEGALWLVYALSGNSNAIGFFTGGLTTTPTTATQGTLTAIGLREVNFGGSGVMAGAITSATYTARVGVSGSLDPVVGTSGSGAYSLSGTGTTTAPNGVGGTITLSNLSYVGTGNANIDGGAFAGGTFTYTQHITSPLQPSLSSFVTGTLALSSSGAITDTYTGCSGTPEPCTAIAPLMGVGQNYSASPFDFSSPASLTWTATTFSTAPGFGTTTTVAQYTATQTSFTPSGMGGITADTFNLNTYNAAYDTAPSLADLAGNYTALSTGIGSTNNPGATFTVSSSGALSLGMDSGSHCAFTATIATHPTGGNVYDVTAITFTSSGGTCVYAGESFAGVAIYDGINKLTITALNPDSDKGFMIIATK